MTGLAPIRVKALPTTGCAAAAVPFPATAQCEIFRQSASH